MKLTYRISRIIIAAFMLSAFFGVLQLTTDKFTPSAHASTQCGSIGACLGTVAAVVVGGNTAGGGLPGSSSGTVPVGPGNVVSNPAPVYICNPIADYVCTERTLYKVDFFPKAVAYGYGCSDRNIGGFTVTPAGVVVTQQNRFIRWNNPSVNGVQTPGNPVFSGWYITGSTCVYPPNPQITATNLRCILNYSATVDRMAQSRLGAANGVGSSSGIVSSVGQLERDGQGACIQNQSVALNYNPPNGQNGWGQYRATSSINQVRCNFATITFEGAADQVGRCYEQTNVPGSTGRMTVWCDGFTNSWILKDWTGSDCQNGSRARLNCTIPTPATYNGYATNPQGLRDGKDGTLLWGTPKVTGGWGMTNWKSSTVVNAGSSPRNSAVGDNNTSQQLFKSSIPFGSSMIAGQNLDQKLAFYTAGDSGSPFSMTRNYRYDAWFQSVYTSIRSIDLRSGNIGVATSYENTFAVNNKCDPQTSPSIDVIRAIGDSVG